MADALGPLMPQAIDVLQNLFVAPAGCSAQVIFVAKNLKILTCTLFFGSAALKIRWAKTESSFYLGFLFGTVAFFILVDRHLIYTFVSRYLLCAYPVIGEMVNKPIVRVSAVFVSGTVVQSAKFPAVVNLFYTALLVLSGLLKDVFF